MIKIYSKVEPTKLLHITNRPIGNAGRIDIAPEEQFLQLALLNVQKGRVFKAHKHIWKAPSYDQVIAQESWVILRGRVKIYLYDIDDSFIETVILGPGDCSMTFEGGHSYEILEDNTQVYEYKTGPYLGQKLDKVFLENL
tara:strand:- start:829 stop:1248 length:420 start_codon:yes stop_codon:yes gene_type:complete